MARAQEKLIWTFPTPAHTWALALLLAPVSLLLIIRENARAEPMMPGYHHHVHDLLDLAVEPPSPPPPHTPDPTQACLYLRLVRSTEYIILTRYADATLAVTEPTVQHPEVICRRLVGRTRARARARGGYQTPLAEEAAGEYLTTMG